MEDEVFNAKNTGFWGAFALMFGAAMKAVPSVMQAYFKYKTKKSEEALAKTIGDIEVMKDIKNVLEILEFGFGVRELAVELFKDGKFQFTALGMIMPLYPKAIAAYEDAGQALPELADLDSKEAEQLVAFVVGKGVANEKAAEIIGKSLKVGVAVIELIKEIKEEPKAA